MIKVFSVDDDEQFLDSIEKFFSPFPEQYQLVGNFNLVGDEEGVADLIDTLKLTKPDIALMDLDFSKVNRPADFGIELTRRISREAPEVKVIVLTQESPFSDSKLSEWVNRAFNAGAVAYLRKDEIHTWLECIKETAEGETISRPLPDSVLQAILERMREASTFRLTNREIEAIRHLSEDNKVQKVAELMKITFAGANFHLDNARVKLGVGTLQGLTAKAIRFGIVF